MILIYAVLTTGERTLLTKAPLGFDVHTWAINRQKAIRLLGIREIVYEEIRLDKP